MDVSSGRGQSSFYPSLSLQNLEVPTATMSAPARAPGTEKGTPRRGATRPRLTPSRSLLGRYGVKVSARTTRTRRTMRLRGDVAGQPPLKYCREGSERPSKPIVGVHTVRDSVAINDRAAIQLPVL